jgi:hypothetical protein
MGDGLQEPVANDVVRFKFVLGEMWHGDVAVWFIEFQGPRWLW